MPQWPPDRDAAANRYPDERWTGRCSRDVAAILVRYDHHTVWIQGRPALLLTYHWHQGPLSEQDEPLSFRLSFTYARGHPAAPKDIQELVVQLELRES